MVLNIAETVMVWCCYQLKGDGCSVVVFGSCLWFIITPRCPLWLNPIAPLILDQGYMNVDRRPLRRNVDSEAIDCHSHSFRFVFLCYLSLLSSCLSGLSLFSWSFHSFHCLSLFALSLLCVYCLRCVCRHFIGFVCVGLIFSVYVVAPLLDSIWTVCLCILFALSGCVLYLHCLSVYFVCIVCLCIVYALSYCVLYLHCLSMYYVCLLCLILCLPG